MRVYLTCLVLHLASANIISALNCFTLIGFSVFSYLSVASGSPTKCRRGLVTNVIYTGFVVGLLRYSYISSCSNLGLGAVFELDE